MGSFGAVPFAAVVRLLRDCAPGHGLVTKKHRQWVLFNGRTYRGLPRAGHGKLEVKIGTVEQMVRYLGIDEGCAKESLPALTL